MTSENINKLQLIIDLLNTLPDRVPDDLKLMTCEHKGSELLEKGTFALKTFNTNGAIITTEELKPFVEYLEQCKSNGKANGIELALYTHSNDRKKNNGIGLCDYKDADFADISIITSEKTIKIHLNNIHPIKRKVGHRVEVQNNK